ncbi:hypothetical protein K438DRAFT_1961563 [Mycena galopus ATCC 62051]|nr:hypothetical protein K438DRAFT_1961563 [Mycena galopus ATCC 62051]
MGIAVLTQFVSTKDLGTMFSKTTCTIAGHGLALVRIFVSSPYNYYLSSGDLDRLETMWANYTLAVSYLEGRINSRIGFFDVTGLRDWGQGGSQHYSLPGPLHPSVPMTSTSLASAMTLPGLADTWTQTATALKQNFNNAFWVEGVGMYRDSLTTTLTPQDGNSFAILFNLATSPGVRGWS